MGGSARSVQALTDRCTRTLPTPLQQSWPRLQRARPAPAELAQNERRQRRLLALCIVELWQALQQQARHIGLPATRGGACKAISKGNKLPAAGGNLPAGCTARCSAPALLAGFPSRTASGDPGLARPRLPRQQRLTCRAVTLSSTRTKLSPVMGALCRGRLPAQQAWHHQRRCPAWPAPPRLPCQTRSPSARTVHDDAQHPCPAAICPLTSPRLRARPHPRDSHGAQRGVQHSLIPQLVLQPLQEAAPQVGIQGEALLQEAPGGGGQDEGRAGTHMIAAQTGAARGHGRRLPAFQAAAPAHTELAAPVPSRLCSVDTRT